MITKLKKLPTPIDYDWSVKAPDMYGLPEKCPICGEEIIEYDEHALLYDIDEESVELYGEEEVEEGVAVTYDCETSIAIVPKEGWYYSNCCDNRDDCLSPFAPIESKKVVPEKKDTIESLRKEVDDLTKRLKSLEKIIGVEWSEDPEQKEIAKKLCMIEMEPI